jgi:hypothetical protein
MKIVVLTPVWDDWAAFRILLERLDSLLLSKTEYSVSVLCVDDGSFDPMPAHYRSRRWRGLQEVKSLRLVKNSGHQRALAVGLGYMSQHLEGVDAVVLMDSDGEDSPEALCLLLEEQKKSSAPVIVAARGKRNEGPLFRFLHAGYKTLFRLVTGKNLQFGNFMLLRPEAIRVLAESHHTGLHVAASLLRNQVQADSITVDRGYRFAGKSRMSLYGLFTHGFAAYSVLSRGKGEPWVPARDYVGFLSRS